MELAEFDDSEDDSDYMPNAACQSQDEEDVDDTSDSADEDEEDEEDEEGAGDNKESVKQEIASISTCLTSGLKSPYKTSCVRILVCSVCLGDVSHPEDEIVECDSCGISVHEACYGIVADDVESVHSNTSSASTEPWFCEPCKASVKEPVCCNVIGII